MLGYVSVEYIFFGSVAYLFFSLSTVITALLRIRVASVCILDRLRNRVATDLFALIVPLVKKIPHVEPRLDLKWERVFLMLSRILT